MNDPHGKDGHYFATNACHICARNEERDLIVRVMERDAFDWDDYAKGSVDQKEKDHGAYMAAMARRFAKNFKEMHLPK